MKPNTYDFRQFQEELAALDRKQGASASNRLAQAKKEFLTLRDRYGLTVNDVVTFFPEEEGVAYLEGLIMKMAAGPARKK